MVGFFIATILAAKKMLFDSNRELKEVAVDKLGDYV